MPVIAVLATVFVTGFEQLVQWRYGPAGIVGLLLLSLGHKARHPTLIAVGAVVLALTLLGQVTS